MIPAQLLRKVSVFEGLNDGQLEKIASLCSEQSHSAGSLICKEGDPANRLFILREGRVALEMGVRLWPERRIRQMSVETLSASQPFGLSALTESDILTMSARALDACRVISIRARDLHLLMEEEGLILRLLQNLDYALAALQLPAGGGVQFGGAELGERLQLSVLGQVKPQSARHLPHRPSLR